jgi:hypothetical protein
MLQRKSERRSNNGEDAFSYVAAKAAARQRWLAQTFPPPASTVADMFGGADGRYLR